ncbi:MAG TPA: response regulator [Anaerolineales bacterium]|nr:response regulator [Anaerolineales bacterium]
MDDSKLLLVVEDIAGIRELLELTLRFKDYEVMAAQNGQEALDMIQSRRPALVVTDILMPRMDGFSLIYHLRKDPGTRDIPVVFLSATYLSPEDKDFATTLGAARFIEKPINMEQFLVTIAQLLSESPASPLPPLQETEFLEKYQVRLETKLEQKSVQIARAERLLQTGPANEKAGFEASLKQALHERHAIEVELENVRHLLSGIDTPQ